jgi:glycogen(starch) synthase
MRVLLAPSAYYPHIGGVEEATRHLAAELRLRGHEVLIVSNRWPHDLPAEEQIEGVTVRRVRLELPALSPRPLTRFLIQAPGAVASILVTVRSFRPDVLHLIGAGPNAAYVALLRRLLGSRIVLTAQGEFGADAHRVFERSLSLRWGLRRLLVKADALTGCSRFVLTELESAFPVSVPRQVIPNAVDPDELGRVEVKPANRPYVLGLGRLVEQKGFDILLQAFARALPALPEHHLVIAGDGPLRPTLEALAKELGLTGRVSFRGSLDRAEVAATLSAAEMFVLSSRVEAFGIALLEAMAVGVPAIATDVGGVLDVAAADETALIVPSEDVDALAGAIVLLASERALRERLAEAARARAKDFTWQSIVPRYEAVYSAAGSSTR